MKLGFKVTYVDGREVDVIAKPVDIMEFERRYATSFTLFDGSSPMEHLYFLAWAPLHRTKQDPRDFDEFMVDIDEIEAADETPRPTKRGRSGGSSPASRSTSA